MGSELEQLRANHEAERGDAQMARSLLLAHVRASHAQSESESAVRSVVRAVDQVAHVARSGQLDEVPAFERVLEECAHCQAVGHSRPRSVHAGRFAAVADDYRVCGRDYSQRAVRETRKVLRVEGKNNPNYFCSAKFFGKK